MTSSMTSARVQQVTTRSLSGYFSPQLCLSLLLIFSGPISRRFKNFLNMIYFALRYMG